MSPNADLDAIRRFVTHPLSLLSVLAGVIASVFQVPLLDQLVMFVWSNPGQLFTVVSVAGTQIAPRFEALPTRWFRIGIVIMAVILVGSTIDGLYKKWQNRE